MNSSNTFTRETQNGLDNLVFSSIDQFIDSPSILVRKPMRSKYCISWEMWGTPTIMAISH